MVWLCLLLWTTATLPRMGWRLVLNAIIDLPMLCTCAIRSFCCTQGMRDGLSHSLLRVVWNRDLLLAFSDGSRHSMRWAHQPVVSLYLNVVSPSFFTSLCFLLESSSSLYSSCPLLRVPSFFFINYPQLPPFARLIWIPRVFLDLTPWRTIPHALMVILVVLKGWWNPPLERSHGSSMFRSRSWKPHC